ncbi:DUF3488 and transglutaminase-like domain-containing protein [Propionimicrobium sp. PCR01-08-3]|uniref:transglutaminase family protein n=1 Tax=Propionimicrobium sp. PCR01-08-3 TaxID=3052086 RepID=UPI00255CC3FE|nr:DUF3488 and transglutaminase-like domain-containing protein [Propionimicrobium sp. PCR01-08-3]WIY81656.1 DUF3488 and transglutaminase-like domain-containing protein [Propionimicrobium sp. PCR01-08-3]
MIGSARNSIAVVLAAFLGAIPLTQLSSDARLLPAAAIVIVLLELAAWLTRRLTARIWPGTFAQVVAQLAMIWIGCAAAVGDGAQDNPWQVFGLVWSGAGEHIYQQTVPMDANDPVLVVLLAAIGLLTIGIDLAFIAAGSALLAAVPLLGGYLASMIVLDHAAGIVSIVAVCVGWLILLASRTIDHEKRWPRGLTSKDAAKFNLRGFTGLAATLGAISIGVAVVAGMAIPPDNPTWRPRGSSSGGSSVDLVDPTIELNENLHRPDERPLISYTTSAPGGVQLRNTALTAMDANGWHLQQMDLEPGNPDVPEVTGTTPQPISTSIAIGDYESDYLPVPYFPRGWDAEGSWNYDPSTLTVLNVDSGRSGQALTGLPYAAESVMVQPSDDEIAAASAGADQGIVVPDDVPADIVDLAHQLTDDSPTAGAKALALESWLADPAQFSYDLNAPEGTGYDVLLNFLFTDRRGYCIHFASSMAVMAEVIGIPARVAVGFTAGTQQDDGSWLVTSHNMHAWPELYFEGLGWVSFEPTVSIGSGGQPPETSPEPTPQTPSEEPTAPAESQEPTQSPEPSAPAPGPGESGQPIDLRIPLGFLAAIVIVAAPATARALQRRRRLGAQAAPDRVRGAWRELHATAIDVGLTWPKATPRQAAASGWPGLKADGRRALRHVALLVERQRFAAVPPAEADVAADVALITTQWYAHVSKGKRLMARVLPRSLFMGRREPD